MIRSTLLEMKCKFLGLLRMPLQVILSPERRSNDPHSNPIGSGVSGAAPAASFLRLDPNRPGLRRVPSPRSSSAGPLPIEIYRYSVMTITFPAMFYIFFGIVIRQGSFSGVSAPTYALTIMGVMGVMFASLMGLGAGIASERGLGWLEVKRASPMPSVGWFAAKLSTAMLFSALVSGILFALGAANRTEAARIARQKGWL